MRTAFQVLNLQPFHSGGNGDLFLGVRSDSGERVVVKYLREFHLPHARKGFLREVRVRARKLRGFMPLLGWNLEDQKPFYVMPYLPATLTQYSGKLNQQSLHAVATDLALTLANLHATGVAHGDIKPDNILVSNEGHLQVADPLGNGVGCTVVLSQNRGGTPGYWAPEILGGASISLAGDVYSYGATLYQLLTGQRPVDGQKFDSAKITVAPKLWEIICACCHSAPSSRPTMPEVLRILNGEQWTNIRIAKQNERLLIWLCVLAGLLVMLGFMTTE